MRIKARKLLKKNRVPRKFASGPSPCPKWAQPIGCGCPISGMLGPILSPGLSQRIENKEHVLPPAIWHVICPYADPKSRQSTLSKGSGTMQVSGKQTLPFADSALVEFARKGDREAFGELIRRHQHKCIDLATFFLRNRDDAEDEAQNAFSKAYMHLDQYKGDAEFSTWLGRIVANQCLMLMRVRRNARYVYLDEPATRTPRPQHVEVPANGGDPEGELACQQMTDALKKEIHRIPSVLRKVMLLRDIQELPMPDVAARLGISVPAAKSRLLRARTELRSRLKRYTTGMGNTSPLSRSAAPLNRVARHCAIRPAEGTYAGSRVAV